MDHSPGWFPPAFVRVSLCLSVCAYVCLVVQSCGSPSLLVLGHIC